MVTGLDVLGAVAATLQIATEVAALLRAYHNAPTDIISLATRLDDDVSLLTELKSILERTCGENLNSPPPDDSYDHIQRVLLYIGPLLRETKVKVEKLIKGSSSLTARARWLVVGADIQKAEKELFEWSQRLSLRLTLLPHQCKVDLSQSVNQSSFGALKAQVRMEETYQRFLSMATVPVDPNDALPCSSLPSEYSTTARTIITLCENSASHTVILEPKPIPEAFALSPESMSWVQHELHKLTSLLRAASPTEMHVLRAHGFASLSPDSSNRLFGLLYDIPRGFSPQYYFLNPPICAQSFPSDRPATFHSLLSATSKSNSRLIAQHPLSQRFELARQIATAVFYCHSIGWVHKSISSHNIILLSRSTESAKGPTAAFPQSLGTAFLAGFEYSRRETDRSTGPVLAAGTLDEAEHWKHQIYQHPERQIAPGEGVDPDIRYRYGHDLYSLGVVLLELGRWRTLDAAAEVLRERTAEERRSELIGMGERVAVVVGERYARVVRRCLEGGEWEGGRKGELGREVAGVVGELEELVAAVS